MNQKIRVRFAPSPTGPLHIGGVRTALYNYLFAKKHGGSMILRIEDTDQTRFVPGAEDYIVEAFRWLNIPFDEGVQTGGAYAPYKQSERKPLYKQYIEELIKKGAAYYAFDTAEELENLRKEYESRKETFIYNAVSRKTLNNSLNLPESAVQEKLASGAPYTIRFKMPENKEISMKDIIRGDITVHSNTLDDKILFKSDGMPTYHLANIVDDHLMEISHVIRGEEWLPSMPLHVLLYEAFEWDAPQFAHLPLLLRPDGNGKLSKRDGDRLGFPVFPLEWTDPKTEEKAHGYREDGYLSEAVINMLALLGWNPGTDKEIFSMEELIEAFSLERVGKSGSKFDVEKAKWFNQQYLRAYDNSTLAQMLTPILEYHQLAGYISESYVEKVVALIKDRVNFVSDFWEQGRFFFLRPESYDPQIIKKRWKDGIGGRIIILSIALDQLHDWDAPIIKDAITEFIQKGELNMGQMMNCLRLLLVGAATGPDLADIMAVLGKMETLLRIREGIKVIEAQQV
ncbi:MAG: glutamate--tRNA ligase [Bacteroidales bacterium]|jgi:glutamyl-tRNA synthetase|nr:glutamate--tRNA ligase [Bacteroidales bacterium]